MDDIPALQPLRNGAGASISVASPASRPIQFVLGNSTVFGAQERNAVQNSISVPASQPIRRVQDNSIVVGTSVNTGTEKVSPEAQEAEAVAYQHDINEESARYTKRGIAQDVQRAELGFNAQSLGIVTAASSPPSAGALGDDPFGSPTRPLLRFPVLPREAMQAVDEVATRTFHSTMKHRAPKPTHKSKTSGSKTFSHAGRLEQPSPPSSKQPVPNHLTNVNDQTCQFIADLKANFVELLRGLRGFQGELNIQADFGRILLKVAQKHITGADSEQSMAPHMALEILEAPYAAPTVFTKILTVLPADMSALIEMKDCSGAYLWKQVRTSWDVLYEFLCVDTRTRKHRPFTIEIDGERLSCQAKTRLHLGAINVHGVKRHWDFRVSATGVHTESDIDPIYGEFAKIVRDSLHIP